MANKSITNFFHKGSLFLQRLFFLKKEEQDKKVIILGVDYPEYCLVEEFKSRQLKIAFVISENPWQYKCDFHGIECRNPIELLSLCTHFNIDCIYYCDKAWLNKIPQLPPTISLKLYK